MSSIPLTPRRREELARERELAEAEATSRIVEPRRGDLVHVERRKNKNGVILWTNKNDEIAYVKFFKTKEVAEDHTELSLDDFKQYSTMKGRRLWTIEG